jgi:sulfonate transport system permease protein
VGRVLPAASVALVLLVAWGQLSQAGMLDPVRVPAPTVIFSALLAELRTADLYRHIGATLRLMATGYGLGMLGGLAIGTLMALNRGLDAALFFYVEFLRALPAAALIPIFLILFAPETARPLVVAASCALVIIVACRLGIRHAEPARLEVVQALRFSALSRFRKLLFWEMLREALVGARIALSLALVLATVIEMLLGARYGLGDLIVSSQPTNKPLMYASVIVLGVVGYGLNVLFGGVERLGTRFGLIREQE